MDWNKWLEDRNELWRATANVTEVIRAQIDALYKTNDPDGERRAKEFRDLFDPKKD